MTTTHSKGDFLPPAPGANRGIASLSLVSFSSGGAIWVDHSTDVGKSAVTRMFSDECALLSKLTLPSDSISTVRALELISRNHEPSELPSVKALERH